MLANFSVDGRMQPMQLLLIANVPMFLIILVSIIAAGTADMLHSLRHFVRWRHPVTCITELNPSLAQCCFEV
jgi:hypothetical protein